MYRECASSVQRALKTAERTNVHQYKTPKEIDIKVCVCARVNI